jgi:hypothetical protein
MRKEVLRYTHTGALINIYLQIRLLHMSLNFHTYESPRRIRYTADRRWSRSRRFAHRNAFGCQSSMGCGRTSSNDHRPDGKKGPHEISLSRSSGLPTDDQAPVLSFSLPGLSWLVGI